MSRPDTSADAIAAYLVALEHVDEHIARRAAARLSEVWAARWLFRPWAAEALVSCLPGRYGSRAEVELAAGLMADRLAGRCGVRLHTVYVPACPGCGEPLRLADALAQTGRHPECTRRPA